eukprot:8273173-Pyramimonas_sp.AAC.1
MSKVLPSRTPGRVLLRQTGVRQSLCWRLEGSALIELAERPAAFDGRELMFHMLEGDFEKFEGRWAVFPLSGRNYMCKLLYEVDLDIRSKQGKDALPVAAVRRILPEGMPDHLRAVCEAIPPTVASSTFPRS